MNHIVLVQMLPVPRISGHLQRIKLPASVHSLSKIRSDHIGHYCLSKMVGPGNAHILGRFPLTGSRLLCHILVLLHKRYKITQNLPLVHKTGEGTCPTKEAVGTCGVQVKSHWSIPFPFLGLYVHGPYDVNILDVITFYRSVIQLLFTGQCHLVSDARKVCPFLKRADVQVKIDVSGGIRDIFHPVSLRME